MGTLLTVVFSLLLVNSGAAALRAQSGRNRSVPVAGEVGKPSQSSVDAPEGDGADSKPEEVEGDVVRVETALVTIPVSVRDRQGRYAPDLSREDFRVFEDGVEQRVAYFATVDQPFTVALLTDGVDTTSHASYNGTLRRQYSLGYYPKAAGKNGERRQIKVQVNRPELVVQARDSYVYSQPKSDDKEAGGQQPKDAETPRQLHGGVR